MSAPPIRTIEDAAAFVDRVGVALVFPRADVVLPSLWHAAGGADEYAVRDDGGNFVRWSEPMAFVWPTKDELPARGLCAAGKHVRGRASLVALDVLPALVAVGRRDELDPLENEIVELLRAAGAPVSARELPDLLPAHDRKRVHTAIERLQKAFVVTNAGFEETDGWPAILLDLVDRRYAGRLADVPSAETARRTLAARILDAAGELTAEDLRGALGWRKHEAREALASLDAPARQEHGYTIWSRRKGDDPSGRPATR